MAVRRLAKSWQYDFKIEGHPRQRKGGWKTKKEAEAAERTRREELLSGKDLTIFADAYKLYLEGTRLKDRSRDSYELLWRRIKPELGYRIVSNIDTTTLDKFKTTLPDHLGPKSVNQHLILVRAVLRFMWKRGRLNHVPYVPMEPVVPKRPSWYSQEERDQLLDGMFRLYPQWYLFFYITCRLGLRRGEVYALSHRQVRDIPPQLIVDQQVQRGTRTRPAKIVPRKNNEAYELDLTHDVVDAVRWHVAQEYAGDEFLFCKSGSFPVYLDGYVRPMQTVQRRLGLPLLGHHSIGRHSVASQAATGGQSIKAIQAQLGHRSEQSTHRYAHLGSGAQLRIVESLAPARPPHVNVVSTGKKMGS